MGRNKDMEVAFYQFLTAEGSIGGTLKGIIKRTFTGGASITGLTLAGSIGRPMAGAYNPVSLKDGPFDIAAISFNTPGAPWAYRAAKFFKKLGKITIAGGPHCSLLPEESLEYFDAVCIGPGDKQFSKMIEDAGKGRLRRLYYGGRGDWVIPRREKSNGISLVQLSRGCHHRCRFCVVPKLYGDGIDEKPLELVKAELHRATSLVNLVDDNFPVNTKRGQDILTFLKDSKKHFICQISPELVAEEVNLSRLADAGCTILGVGIESIRPESQLFLGKSPVKNTKEIIGCIHDAGIASYINLVFGSDGETSEIFEKTLKFIDDVRPTIVSAHLLTPFPGTKIYDYFAQRKRLLFGPEEFPRVWAFFDCRHATIIPDPMTPEQLSEGFFGFVKELYSLRNTFRRVQKGRLGVALLSSLLKNAW